MSDLHALLGDLFPDCWWSNSSSSLSSSLFSQSWVRVQLRVLDGKRLVLELILILKYSVWRRIVFRSDRNHHIEIYYIKSARALPQNQFNCDNQIISNCRPSAICFIGIVWIKVLNSLDEYFTLLLYSDIRLECLFAEGLQQDTHLVHSHLPQSQRHSLLDVKPLLRLLLQDVAGEERSLGHRVVLLKLEDDVSPGHCLFVSSVSPQSTGCV